MIGRLFLIVQLLFICFCAKIVDHDNPHDSNFKGEYGLSASLSPGHDTLQILFDYTLTVSDTGKNKLHHFKASSSRKVVPSFDDSYTFTRNPVFMFAATGLCTLSIEGTASNSDTILRTIPCTITNPYIIAVDTVSLLKADSIRFTIENTGDSSSRENDLSVHWNCSWFKSGSKKNILRKTSDSLDFNSAFTVITSEDTSYLTVTATLLDGTIQIPLDNPIHLDTLTAHLPTIVIASDDNNDNRVMVTSGQPTEIRFLFSHTDSVSIFYKDTNQTFATENTEFFPYSINETWDGTSDSSIVIQAKNIYEIKSPPETLIVVPVNTSIWLVPVELPTVATVDKQTEWHVKVEDKNGTVPDSRIEYFWRLSLFDADKMDTSSTGGTLKINFKDDVENLVIRVMAQRCDEAYGDKPCDSTLDTQVFVQAKSYRPTLKVMKKCDSVLVGSSCTFYLVAEDDHSDNKEGTVEKLLYYFNISPSDTIEKPIDDSIVIEMPLVDTILFWCEDDDGFPSRTVAVPVDVHADYPHFPTREKTVTAFVDEPRYIHIKTIAGNSEDIIDEWEWDLDGDGSMDTSTEVDSIEFTGSEKDTVTLLVRCTNKRGYSSEDTAKITVIVSEGPPEISAVACTTTTTYINDAIELSVEASDPNASGKITGIVVYLNESDSVEFTMETPSKNIDTAFTLTIPSDTSEDSYAIAVRVIDDDDLFSEVFELSHEIDIAVGRPVVNDISPSTVWIYDDTTYSFSASDINGNIDTYIIRVDDEDPVEQENSTYKHRFSSDGLHTIVLQVKDNDGLLSASREFDIHVNLGKPTFEGIAISPIPEHRYVNDDITFQVTVSDSNDTHMPLNVGASWDGDETFEQTKDDDDDVTFTHSFDTDEYGDRTIRFRVTDADNISHDTTIQLTILQGTPTVSIALSTPPESLFVNDSIRFSIRAEDPNPDGYIVAAIIQWDSSVEVYDTTDISGEPKLITPTAWHIYDTTGGEQTVTIWSVDDDGVVSEPDQATFMLDKGAPILFGDNGDTLFVVIDDGIGINKHYPIKVKHDDPNGTIVRYYWNSSNSLTGATVTEADTIMAPFTSLTTFTSFIFARDDDSLLRGDEFIIFPDSAPPRPASLTYGTTTDSTILKWEKVLDTKDSLKTQVQIYIKYGNTGEPDSTLFAEPWPSLDDPRFGEETIAGLGLHATYTFKPTTSGRWRVVLRDARGTENTAGDPATFVVP